MIRLVPFKITYNSNDKTILKNTIIALTLYL